MLFRDAVALIRAILVSLEEDKVIEKATEVSLFDDLSNWEKYLDAVGKLFR